MAVRGRKAKELATATAWLAGLLKPVVSRQGKRLQFRLSTNMKKSCSARGFSWRTLNRAKKILGVRSRRLQGEWYWILDDSGIVRKHSEDSKHGYSGIVREGPKDDLSPSVS
jgi:hypothetical protein